VRLRPCNIVGAPSRLPSSPWADTSVEFRELQWIDSPFAFLGSHPPLPFWVQAGRGRGVMGITVQCKSVLVLAGTKTSKAVIARCWKGICCCWNVVWSLGAMETMERGLKPMAALWRSTRGLGSAPSLYIPKLTRQGPPPGHRC
jgi:hypothetical protein